MMTPRYVLSLLFALVWCTAAAAHGDLFHYDSGHEVVDGTARHVHVPGSFGPGELRPSDPDPAKGRFLVATPALKGSLFEQSVILLTDYSGYGAAGLIINKPGTATASEIFPDITELADHREYLYLGGPVELGRVHLLLRSGSRPAESSEILQGLYLCASMDALKEAARSTEKGLKFRMYFGYAGWSPGQLEREILAGSWYVMEGEEEMVFSELPSLIWQKLIRRRSPFYDTVSRDPAPVSMLH